MSPTLAEEFPVDNICSRIVVREGLACVCPRAPRPQNALTALGNFLAVRCPQRQCHFALSAVIVIAVVFVVTFVVLYSSYPFHHVPSLDDRFHQTTNSTQLSPEPSRPAIPSSVGSLEQWDFEVSRDGDNYGLTDAQCAAAFPKLYVEIDKSVAQRRDSPITQEELDSRPWMNGMVRGMVYNGELLIIGAQGLRILKTRPMATLQALNRALISAPSSTRIPNIEFIFACEDYIEGTAPVWAYSKKPTDDNVWIMPDFGYWSWPESRVGAYSRIRARIRAVDQGLLEDGSSTPPVPFTSKVPKLVWRGSLIPNPLRGALYELTRTKTWADIQPLDWGHSPHRPANLLPMEDYCRYQFLAHVEGRSYSGRAKYLQNCRSVLVTHELLWLEAHHHALVPSGPDQNYVRVKRDWSDLESTMKDLLAHPDEAERIAENGARTFRDRYLTPAAEACYWRKLIQGWASVSFAPRFFNTTEKKWGRGVPFESFVLAPCRFSDACVVI